MEENTKGKEYMEEGEKDGVRIGNGKRQKRRKENDEKKILFL